MANKRVFGAVTKNFSAPAPKANTVNAAGGIAYLRQDEEALAQLICTGCLNGTFYASAEQQLKDIVKMASKCSDQFITQAAIYARKMAFMKDMPALMMAILSVRNTAMFRANYSRVIDNPKMLRNLVQIVRSGVVGRKNFGRAIRDCINDQLSAMTDHQLLNATVGNDPSFADIIRLTHPKPKKDQEALFKYILGFPVDKDEKNSIKRRDLPQIVQDYEQWKKNPTTLPPKVDFQLITGITGLGKNVWEKLAEDGNWHFTRMNLNTFERHEVLKDTKTVKAICNKLTNQEQISKARVFPYQLYTALSHVSATIPPSIKNALQDALDLTVSNIPEIQGKCAVFIDGSGSMSSAVTGQREGSTSTMSCLEVACLVGAGLFKRNPDNTDLHIFDSRIKFSSLKDQSFLNPRDSLLTLTNNVKSKSQSGGTAISVCMDEIKGKKYDAVIIISDNESWADFYQKNDKSLTYQLGQRPGATGTAQKWKDYTVKNPNAKLVLIDLQPSIDTQVSTDGNVLNVGGFSNAIFDVISRFFNTNESWVDVIKGFTYKKPNEVELVTEE